MLAWILCTEQPEAEGREAGMHFVYQAGFTCAALRVKAEMLDVVFV
jgi:hypothetical protein